MFLASLPPPGAARDAVILGAIHACGLDPVSWHDVALPDGRVVQVTGRYLSVGGETVPMVASVAQAAADHLGGVLPTPAIVDAIEHAPGVLLAWMVTMRADGSEQSSATFARSDALTQSMRFGFGDTTGRLMAGYRKDVVQPDDPGMLTIYGARWPLGGRLQHVSSRHGLFYADYSHGVRVVRGIEATSRYPLPW